MKEADTMHANYINGLKIFSRDGDKPKALCTSDINGNLNYWDVTK